MPSDDVLKATIAGVVTIVTTLLVLLLAQNAEIKQDLAVVHEAVNSTASANAAKLDSTEARLQRLQDIMLLMQEGATLKEAKQAVPAVAASYPPGVSHD